MCVGNIARNQYAVNNQHTGPMYKVNANRQSTTTSLTTALKYQQTGDAWQSASKITPRRSSGGRATSGRVRPRTPPRNKVKWGGCQNVAFCVMPRH
ncbi:hypothetical protein KCP73_10370 [Salmonella enterica subsp. enterica]|nr:hypothetical protein KCP73_10370 [Salmonella enterica subsp. enterica]